MMDDDDIAALYRIAGVALVAFALALAFSWVLLVKRAVAHEWYPYSCCSDKDCRPVPESSIQMTPEGWLIIPTGELVPFAKARVAPDGQFHRCVYNGTTAEAFVDPNARTICLFTPGMGS